MKSIDLDTQRTLICLAGLFFLAVSLVLSSVGRPPPDILLGIFGSMVVGPVLEGTIQRYREMKRASKDEDR